VCIYVYIYIYMYVCMYVCMYVISLSFFKHQHGTTSARATGNFNSLTVVRSRWLMKRPNWWLFHRDFTTPVLVLFFRHNASHVSGVTRVQLIVLPWFWGSPTMRAAASEDRHQWEIELQCAMPAMTTVSSRFQSALNSAYASYSSYSRKGNWSQQGTGSH